MGAFQPSQEVEPTRAQLKVIHATIKKVTEDIEAFVQYRDRADDDFRKRLHQRAEPCLSSALRTFLILLNPFAPHLTSELWETLGQRFPVTPIGDHRATLAGISTGIPGRGRSRDRAAGERQSARSDHGSARRHQRRTRGASPCANPRVQEFTRGSTIRKVVVIPKKLVNVVAT